MSAAGPRWWGTLLFLPLLLAIGWLLARPLALFAPGLRPDQIDLASSVFALLLLLLSLPARIKRVWGDHGPWRRLGVWAAGLAGPRALLRGLLKALLLLALVVVSLMAAGEVRWGPGISAAQAANGGALLLGVGFAEELAFRGWLWGELELKLGTRRSLLAQAAIFSLAHTRFNLGLWPLLGLLGGLFLLGLVLGLQRRADGGVLWGAVGLHGGLVGGWFVLVAGLMRISPGASAWLVGPGGAHPNPIGGAIGWLGLALLLIIRRRCWPPAAQQASGNP